MAGLTKLPGGLLAPAVVMAWFALQRRPKVVEVIGYLAGCLALIVPWLVLTKVSYGTFVPFHYPTEWLMDHFSYMRLVANRPASYYVVGLLAVSPIYFYCPIALARIRRDPWLWVPVAWAGGIIIALTVMGVSGLGFSLRWLTPAMPALCLLAAAGVSILPWWARVPVFPLAAYTLHVGVLTGMMPTLAEPFPQSLGNYLIEVFGLNISDVFPGMW